MPGDRIELVSYLICRNLYYFISADIVCWSRKKTSDHRLTCGETQLRHLCQVPAYLRPSVMSRCDQTVQLDVSLLPEWIHHQIKVLFFSIDGAHLSLHCLLES